MRRVCLHLSYDFDQVIAAEGEHKASRALRHAAEVIMENPGALQVFNLYNQIPSHD